jgi:sigma-B regulation protein RsbU (phosphoserine phosphatase)
MLPDMVFKTQEVSLEPGDLLLTFTDGVLDARNPAGQLFTEKSFLALLQQPIASATALLNQIETALQAHIGSADQFDDITLLAVRREPSL